MLTIYLHTKVHFPSFNGPLVTAVKLRANENVCTAAMLLSRHAVITECKKLKRPRGWGGFQRRKVHPKVRKVCQVF